MLKRKNFWHKLISFFTFVLLLSIFISCNQDSIFADIAVEPEPITPRIRGTPSSIAEWNNNIYVASLHSNIIHVYSISANRWTQTIQAPNNNKILSLAATNTDLYAVTYSSNNHQSSTLSRRSSNTWTSISVASPPQVIYGSGSDLFIGTTNGTTNNIFRLSGGSPASLNINAHLNGAAGGFIAASNGIYNSAGVLIHASGIDVSGIIEAGGDIYAVSWDGRIFRNPGGNTSFNNLPISSNTFTGAMAEWRPSGGGSSLLLLGVQGRTSYDGGYRELRLSDRSGPHVPGTWGDSTISQDNRSRYEASLARHPVNHIYQPRPGGIIFASTGIRGLWSFKVRDGVLGWNAED